MSICTLTKHPGQSQGINSEHNTDTNDCLQSFSIEFRNYTTTQFAFIIIGIITF